MTNKDNKRLTKVSKVMELFWLAVAIVSLVVVIYIFILDRGINGENAQFLVFPVLAGVMYGFRAGFRKRMEKNMQE